MRISSIHNIMNNKTAVFKGPNDGDGEHRRFIRTDDGRIIRARFEHDARNIGINYVHTSSGMVPVRYNPRTGKYQLVDKNWPDGNMDEIKDILDD